MKTVDEVLAKMYGSIEQLDARYKGPSEFAYTISSTPGTQRIIQGMVEEANLRQHTSPLHRDMRIATASFVFGVMFMMEMLSDVIEFDIDIVEEREERGQKDESKTYH